MFDVLAKTVQAYSSGSNSPWAGLGDTLFVGEGNMSFAVSLLNNQNSGIEKAIVTTFEKEKDLSKDTFLNSRKVGALGAKVFHGADATKLDNYFRSSDKFDTIIFQFPNMGSRDPKYGHNPNHVLIRNFLRSAHPHLSLNGKVMITSVDRPHYDGVFKFEEAAQFSDYVISAEYPFDPRLFKGYSHVNTTDNKSALENHHKFVTRVFKVKK